ncbi:hypothetical protein EJP77_00940 [Paenibacillus zeisoli]|uniref:Uncharacterized protein n=1 Tax=Paenibacillus zeisoli TaxID=2496267 RepID=A0A433XNH3_9BACL|nr:hypothetical protein [Paenibacillus zeisoli]RUT35619.1 hypothetical protein EJP77_00940 [Paenibacillus zeisoli]
MKDRYYVTVEIQDRLGKGRKELEVFSEMGKLPAISDYLDCFRKEGHNMEIKDFIEMMFRPLNPAQSSVISLKVIRALKDQSYHTNNSERLRFNYR